ncbi:hypothetical protein IQ268_12745 [Oculatella sp. LEGE 06141]|uniref:hypothetical protein n=1 Tax=Oculatella sp. LEGE 06141 TaxID=1828648 RepID=UPI00187E88F3|nr:hypothetical protein [Oculatella sp. LEGE 06141]MBE9179431.1 hypothetical protein [Oculatella sp. LEGE 06141]
MLNTKCPAPVISTYLNIGLVNVTSLGKGALLRDGCYIAVGDRCPLESAQP